jgi:hypothetical protein
MSQIEMRVQQTNTSDATYGDPSVGYKQQTPADEDLIKYTFTKRPAIEYIIMGLILQFLLLPFRYLSILTFCDRQLNI